ncbi:MAG TPA: outer membrane protein assembly factor BamE [Burkholderiaceae bacterium]|nr:outer membrane protein assembly factor BamE [Burkholderiaceae bacterium]
MPAVIGGLCIALAVCLPGCASKNPLMEEPAAAASAHPAEPAPAAMAGGNSGVQTIQQRRFFGIFSPYRVDVQQGNFVSREMVAQLKESMKDKAGMTPAQVRFIMGTPLLSDIFHKDRWDYVFRLQKNNGEIISSHVALFFKDNRLVRLEGGDLPTESAYISLIAGNTPSLPAATAPAPAVK